MIPDGWKISKIGDVADIKVGRDLDETAYSKTKSGEYKFPVYSNTVEENDAYGYYNFPEYPKGSLTIVGRGIGLGTAFARNTDFGAIGRLLVLLPQNKSFDAHYLASFINNRLQIHYESGGIPQLPGKTLANYQVILPPIPEQLRIAEILSTWDQAIETTEKLITNSEAQKKALMQELLTGKKRLPGFDGEWTETTLGDLGAVSSAGVDKKVVEGELPVRLLNFLDAYHREFVFNDDLKHEVTAPSSKVSQCNVKKGDVFFTPSSETRDDIGLCAVAAEDIPGVVYSYHVVRLRPKQKLDLNFSAYIFQTDNFKRQTYRMGDGSGQRYVISQSNFRKMEIDIPPLPEQQVIGEILAKCSNQITMLQNNLERLKREKSALMQQLLTGKCRVAINKEEAA
jgi:type I restriction enzyme S subunit